MTSNPVEQRLTDLTNRMIRIGEQAITEEFDGAIKSGEQRSNEDFSRTVVNELMDVLLDPEIIVDIVDYLRMRHYCAYASPDHCDCKYMPDPIEFLIDGPPPRINSEQTGCPEIRRAMSALRAGDWQQWQSNHRRPTPKGSS